MNRAALSWAVTLLAIVWLSQSGVAGPVEAAHAHAQKLLPTDAQHTRYLSCRHMDLEEMRAFKPVLDLWPNLLSRHRRITLPQHVGEQVYAVDLRDYGWKTEVWERLAEVEPYHHTRVKQIVEVKERFKQWYGYKLPGGGFKRVRWEWDTKTIKQEKIVVAHSGAEAATLAALGKLCRTQAPFVDADWWFTQVAIQEERVAGYYDWFEFKSEADAKALAGFHLEDAQRIEREIAAVVQPGDSEVARHGRQAFRFGTIAGAWWETRDVLSEARGKKHPVDNLDADYDWEAKRVFFTLPNRLFGFVLADREGKLAESAPEDIGGNRSSTSPDTQIHFVSCYDCHDGLRKIDDFLRKTYKGPAEIRFKDKATRDRNVRLYFEKMKRDFDGDMEDYTYALTQVGGEEFTPEKASAAIRSAWHYWYNRKVSGAQVARRIGVTEEEAVESWRKYSRVYGLPPSTGALWNEGPAPTARVTIEEHFHVLAAAALGQTPIPRAKEE